MILYSNAEAVRVGIGSDQNIGSFFFSEPDRIFKSGVLFRIRRRHGRKVRIRVYGEDGAQLPPADADKLIGYVNAIENELEIEAGDEAALTEKGLIQIIGEEIDQAYLDKLTSISVNPDLAKETEVKVSP